MRIIRVSGCQDCPYKFSVVTALPNIYCGHPEIEKIMGQSPFLVSSYVKSETLPDKCPNEKLDIPKLIELEKIRTLSAINYNGG